MASVTYAHLVKGHVGGLIRAYVDRSDKGLGVFHMIFMYRICMGGNP